MLARLFVCAPVPLCGTPAPPPKDGRCFRTDVHLSLCLRGREAAALTYKAKYGREHHSTAARAAVCTSSMSGTQGSWRILEALPRQAVGIRGAQKSTERPCGKRRGGVMLTRSSMTPFVEAGRTGIRLLAGSIRSREILCMGPLTRLHGVDLPRFRGEVRAWD
jgi:hypothetical protein